MSGGPNRYFKNFTLCTRISQRVFPNLQPSRSLVRIPLDAYHFLSQHPAVKMIMQFLSGEKVYKCMCGRTFTKYTDLLYHKHADEEPEPEYKETMSAGGKEPVYLWKYPDSRKTYYCEFCLKAYSNAHDLKYHIYSHRGERQFTIGASRYLMGRNV